MSSRGPTSTARARYGEQQRPVRPLGRLRSQGSTTGQHPVQNGATNQYPAQGGPTGQYPAQNAPTGQYPAQGGSTGQYPAQNAPTGQYRTERLHRPVPGAGRTDGPVPGTERPDGSVPGSRPRSGHGPVPDSGPSAGPRLHRSVHPAGLRRLEHGAVRGPGLRKPPGPVVHRPVRAAADGWRGLRCLPAADAAAAAATSGSRGPAAGGTRRRTHPAVRHARDQLVPWRPAAAGQRRRAAAPSAAPTTPAPQRPERRPPTRPGAPRRTTRSSVRPSACGSPPRAASPPPACRAGSARKPRAGHGSAATAHTGPQVSRAPDDVRGRLTNLRRGIAQGRQAGTGPTGSYPSPTHQQER